jgi:hypothetical protein
MSDTTPGEVNDPDYDDPILAEIRQIKDEFSDRFNGDMSAMYHYFVEERRRNPIQRMFDNPPHIGELTPDEA